ncbi:MAG: AAA family ATPase [Candidatus Tectomicrobia bacterium]|nr:AAA family ATPase [Candidatus Tectomicrobia bacterium]
MSDRDLVRPLLSVEGFFECRSLGPKALKGISRPIDLFHVLHESAARNRLDVAVTKGLTPLVGREQELGLLLERWEQVKEGIGQVVILNGEAGIGKSRLVQMVKEYVAKDPQAWLTPCQCSPYHQNSALYPIIDLLERVVLQFGREETPQQRLNKLEGVGCSMLLGPARVMESIPPHRPHRLLPKVH